MLHSHSCIPGILPTCEEGRREVPRMENMTSQMNSSRSQARRPHPLTELSSGLSSLHLPLTPRGTDLGGTREIRVHRAVLRSGNDQLPP